MKTVIQSIFCVSLIAILLTGCTNGFAYGNASGTPVKNVTVSGGDFICRRYDGWGGGIKGTREPFPDKLNFSWEDSRTGEIKSVELDVPKQARGYPLRGMKMTIHSNGVIEVKGGDFRDHGYKRKITDQW